jgi:hypothetical protein
MTIMGPICEYCNEYKINDYYGYSIFENGLMEFIIENDVGFICLKCGYYLKSL